MSQREDPLLDGFNGKTKGPHPLSGQCPFVASRGSFGVTLNTTLLGLDCCHARGPRSSLVLKAGLWIAMFQARGREGEGARGARGSLPSPLPAPMISFFKSVCRTYPAGHASEPEVVNGHCRVKLLSSQRKTVQGT